jgi:hypothetical protein
MNVGLNSGHIWATGDVQGQNGTREPTFPSWSLSRGTWSGMILHLELRFLKILCRYENCPQLMLR